MEATIGKRLAQARKAAGLTQKDLAARFELDPITLSRYERDAQPVSVQRAEDFALSLGVSSAWLLLGIGDGPTPLHDDVDPVAPDRTTRRSHPCATTAQGHADPDEPVRTGR